MSPRPPWWGDPTSKTVAPQDGVSSTSQGNREGAGQGQSHRLQGCPRGPKLEASDIPLFLSLSVCLSLSLLPPPRLCFSLPTPILGAPPPQCTDSGPVSYKKPLPSALSPNPPDPQRGSLQHLPSLCLQIPHDGCWYPGLRREEPEVKFSSCLDLFASGPCNNEESDIFSFSREGVERPRPCTHRGLHNRLPNEWTLTESLLCAKQYSRHRGRFEIQDGQSSCPPGVDMSQEDTDRTQIRVGCPPTRNLGMRPYLAPCRYNQCDLTRKISRHGVILDLGQTPRPPSGVFVRERGGRFRHTEVQPPGRQGQTRVW